MLDRDPVANMVVVAKPVLAVPHSNRTDLRGNPIRTNFGLGLAQYKPADFQPL